MQRKILIISIFIIILCCDQFSKWIVRQKLPIDKSIPIIDNIVSITHTMNTGAAFGILSNRRFFLITVSLISMIIILWGVLKYTLPGTLIVPTGLLLGGISGNLCDRITRGYVTDFIEVKYFSVFNIADAAVTIGTLLILISLIFTWKK